MIIAFYEDNFKFNRSLKPATELLVRATSARDGARGRGGLGRAVRAARTAVAVPFLLRASARSERGAAADRLAVFTTLDGRPPIVCKFHYDQL